MRQRSLLCPHALPLRQVRPVEMILRRVVGAMVVALEQHRAMDKVPDVRRTHLVGPLLEVVPTRRPRVAVVAVVTAVHLEAMIRLRMGTATMDNKISRTISRTRLREAPTARPAQLRMAALVLLRLTGLLKIQEAEPQAAQPGTQIGLPSCVLQWSP